METVLIIEDSRPMQRTLQRLFEADSLGVRIASDGVSGLESFRQEPPNVVVLDLKLPGLSGKELCRSFKTEMPSVPIVILSANADVDDKVVLLELGADDYVTKPFSPKELVARVAALLRRVARPTTALAHYGPIVIDPDRHQVTLDGAEVKLTAKEFLLLQYLVQHRGRVLSRDLLLSDVWGYQYTGGTRTVDVHVRRLREKLPVLAEAIETIKQFGYKLADRP